MSSQVTERLNKLKRSLVPKVSYYLRIQRQFHLCRLLDGVLLVLEVGGHGAHPEGGHGLAPGELEDKVIVPALNIDVLFCKAANLWLVDALIFLNISIDAK